MSAPQADPVNPAELALRHHLASASAADALSRGWLRIDDLSWPELTTTVIVPNGQLTLRLELTGYPSQAPTGQPWDLAHGQPLPVTLWPAGARASEVFSPGWSPSNGNALYLPLDRRAQIGHDSWATQHASYWWTAGNTVLDYLQLVREILRSATIPKVAA